VVLETKPVRVTEKKIEDVLGRFRGAIDQTPPMHSALKRDGVPLYKLARKGQSVERKPRRIEIHNLALLAREGKLLELRVRCSKGTYIRALAEDIARPWARGAHLAALRRTAAGRFRLTDAATLDALKAMPDRRARLLPLSALLEGLPRAELDAAGEARLRNGQTLNPGAGRGLCAVYGAAAR
jgi:tRNA pseudouridine55 synthase